MNAVPASERGQASGARATTMNAGQLLSIGIFFSLMIVGLAATLPQAMEQQLIAQHVPAAVAHQVAQEPPVASLFAAFLGYNPMGGLIPANVLQALPAGSADTITGGASSRASSPGRSCTASRSPSPSRSFSTCCRRSPRGSAARNTSTTRDRRRRELGHAPAE